MPLERAGDGVPAQSVNVRTDVPFSFNLNKDTLGQYKIIAISQSGSHLLLISNREAKTDEMFLTHAVSTSPAEDGKGKLVFKRYGDQYFLSQIWLADSETGRELPISPRERELALGHAPAKAVVMAKSR